MAAVWTPTANLFRAVAFAAAVVLIATACGGASSNYVSHKEAQTYFKVPKDWDFERIPEDKKLSFNDPVLVNQTLWAVFYAPKGLHQDALSNIGMSPAPLGYAIVGQLEQGNYDDISDALLRAILVTDSTGQTQAFDPIALGVNQDDDVVRILGIQRIASDGLRGYRIVYEAPAPESPRIVYDRTMMVHDASRMLYRFQIACASSCFEEYVDDIKSIVDSLRVRRDQP